VGVAAAAPALTITHIAAAGDSHGLAAAGITFTDADTQRTVSQYSGTINWGDGTAASGMTFVRLHAGQFAAAGVHQYAHSGTYTVVITVKDTGGASAKQTTTLTVVRR
jgi:PKD repeat protein